MERFTRQRTGNTDTEFSKIGVSEVELLATESLFNAFAVFSPDGKQLVFSSNRNNGGTRDTNVFIADWRE